MSWIIGFFSQLVCWIKSGVVDALNWIISGLASAVGAVVGLMPNLPAFPTPPEWFTTAASWVAWVLPVDQIALVFAFILGAWIIWQGVSVLLRWARFLA
jgi:hypothetical protein